MKIIRGVPPRGTYDFVALDLEAFGLKRSQLHRPFGRFASLAVAVDPKTVFVVTREADVEKVYERLDRAVKVYHSAGFDVPHLRRWCDFDDHPIDKFWDTLIIERILFAGWYDSFELGDLARRHLGQRMFKDVRRKFYESENPQLTEEMIEYNARDALNTWLIAQKQMPLLEADPQSKRVWEWIDGPAFWAIEAFKGVKLNLTKWDKLSAHFAEKAARLKDELKFNPASSKQTLAALAERKIILDSSNAGLLEHYRDDPMVAKILEFREAQKLATTYGPNFHDFVESDGRIYPKFGVNPTVTGRTACVMGDTLLETNRGTFCISGLVLTEDTETCIMTHRNRPRRILRKIYKGRAPMFMVTTNDGSFVKCTSEHRLLTPSGWRSLHEIKEGDEIIGSDYSGRQVHSKIALGRSGEEDTHRDGVCENFLEDATHKEGGTSSIQHKSKCHKCNLEVLPRNIRRGVVGIDSRTLLCSDTWEYTRKKTTSIYTDPERCVAECVVQSPPHRVYCKTAGCEPIHTEKKHGLLWHSEGGVSSETTTECGFRTDQKTRCLSPRNTGCCAWFLGESPSILQCIIRSIHTDNRNSVVCEISSRPLRTLEGNRKDTERSHLLEYEQGGDNSIFSTHSGKNSSYQAVQVPQEVHGGFSCGWEVIGRGGRIDPQDRLSEDARGPQNCCYEKNRIQDIEGVSNRRGETFNRCYRQNKVVVVTSIDLIGIDDVWDIEVEDDHSYISQGLIHHNSSGPNAQNIPHNDEFRGCFESDIGNVFIKADYSSQEPRVSAALSGDRKLLDAFETGESPYVAAARVLFHNPKIERSKKYDVEYRRAKAVVLGIAYGLTCIGLADREKISKDEAQTLIDDFLRHFSGMASYMAQIKIMGANQGFIRTLGGRRAWLNTYQKFWGNAALNYPVQGTAADISKRALVRIYEKYNRKTYPVNMLIHDEIDAEVPRKDGAKTAKLIQSCMEDGFRDVVGDIVKGESEVHVGRTWAG